MPSIELQARRRFPGAEKGVQLDAAGISIVSTDAQQAVGGFLTQVGYDASGAHMGADGLEGARAAAAQLIGARPQEIALVHSTSAGMNIAADAIRLEPGDNVVTSDLEFVSVIAPFQALCQDNGGTLKVARTEGGRLTPEALLQQVDARTRAVVISSVVWTNGWLVDLATIGRECRRLGVPFIVDAIQQLGAIPLDVEASCVDVVVSGGHKWLGSPAGMGLLYASDAFCERHAPTLPYAPTAISPQDDWLALWSTPDFSSVRPYPHAAGAERFEFGAHHAAMGAYGLKAALDVLMAPGKQEVRDHVVALGNLVAAELTELGLEVVTPLEDAHRTGITSFHAGSSGQDDVEMVAHLRASGIVTCVRYTAGVGGTRVSCHLYNNHDDVDKLVTAVRRKLGR